MAFEMNSDNSYMFMNQGNQKKNLISQGALGAAFLGASLLFGTTAQLLLKYGTLIIHDQPTSLIPYFWVCYGLGIYAVGTAFWILCLRYLDLSYAYPFTGLNYVAILIGSWAIFDEKISWLRISGVLLICLGVMLIPQRKR